MEDRIAGFTIKFRKEVNKKRKNLPDFEKKNFDDFFIVKIPSEEIKHLMAATTMGQNYRGLSQNELTSMINYSKDSTYSLLQFSFLKRHHDLNKMTRNVSIFELIYEIFEENNNLELILIGSSTDDKIIGFILRDKKGIIEAAILTSYLTKHLDEFCIEINNKI